VSTVSHHIDFGRLLRLRLVVARYGEMDAARWWNTGDATRRTALLGRAGSVLMSRGFPRTHRFAQARLVFEVARARCAEVFDPPGCITLWNLPPALEDQFDARWARWLEDRDAWTEFFSSIEPTADRPARDHEDARLAEAPMTSNPSRSCAGQPRGAPSRCLASTR
jgi:hypothetical protein